MADISEEKMQKLIAQAKQLGLTGESIATYVQSALEREERMAQRQREEKEREAELELKMKEMELKDKERQAQIEREEKEREAARELKREERQAQMEREERERKAQMEREERERQVQKEIKLKEMELEEKRIEKGILTKDTSSQGNGGQNSSKKSKTNFPKLPVFHEEKDDIDSFLFRFEAHAKAVGWKEEDWPIAMGTLLQGNALSVYHGLCALSTFTYNDLKQALLTKFQCTREGFREKFRSCRPDQEESFQSFYTRLKHLFNRWIEMAKIDNSFDDLFDLVLSEQILLAVSKDLAVFLRERSLNTSKEIIETAECYRLAHPGKNMARSAGMGLVAFSSNFQSGGSQKTVHRGGGYDRGRGQYHGGQGHQSSRDQESSSGPQDSQNQRFQRGGFRGRGRGGQRGSSSTNSGTFKCYGCGGVGHRKSDCLSSKSCSFCGGSYHTPESCPTKGKKSHAASGVGTDDKPSAATVGVSVNPDSAILCSAKGVLNNLPISEGAVNGIQVSVLRDSGANIAGVRRGLVLPHQFLKREQEVISFGGQVQTFPLAEVEVQTSFYTGPLVCCVIQDPVVDLIVGNVKGVSSIPGLIVGNDKAVVSAVVTRAQKKRDEMVPKPLPVHNISVDVTAQKLKQLQSEDSTLAKFVQLANSSDDDTQSQYKFEFQEGILVRVYLGEGEEIVQVVVPQSLRSTVLSTAHDGLLAGHCGVRKTLARVQNRFWWPGVSSDTRRFVQSCDICQKVVPKGRIPDIPLSQMPLIDEPFHRVAVDIVGPLSPMSEDKHKYILTIVDVATRFPEAVPMRSIDSVSVAEALFSVFSRLGFPVEIHTDNGSQFTSDMFKQFLQLLQIKSVRSSPYHAQSNGVVERFHGTLKPMIKKTVQNHPKLWHRYLPALLFACREMKNESTGFAPFELLFGRKPRGPIDFLADSLTDNSPNSQARTVTQHVFELKNTIADMAELAKTSVQDARKVQKYYHDKKAHPRSFSLNDEVLVLLPTSSNKLLMTWKGPFKVVQCLEFDYLIDVGGKTRIFHPNMLKKYHRRVASSSAVVLTTSEGQSVRFSEILSPEYSPVLLQSNDIADVEVDRFSRSPSVASVAVVMDTDSEEGQDDNDPGLQTLSSGETFRDVQFDEKLSTQQRGQIQDVFRQYTDVLTSDPGKFNLGVEHEVKLESDKPVFIKQYPLPFQALQTIEKEVMTMLNLGVIEPSRSSYSAPVVLVKKPDGSMRFCCDYRMLNKVTISDAEPIPDHDSLFAQVSSAKFFTKVDLSKGYWQILVKEEDRHKTAFQTHLGLFQWVRMPFGLATAPATFARAMRELKLGPNAINFFDDILIFSSSWDQHLLHVEEVLQKLKTAGFTARPSKIFAGFRQLQFLGHMIGEGTLRPESEKVEKILNISTPTTKRQVRALLGLVSYYRRYVPDFASITAPISDLLGGRATRQISWTPVCQKALEEIQKILSKAPVLLLPDFKHQFTVRTDASSFGIGGVLLQEVDNKLHPISFVSRKLLPRETRYSTIERECLAIVWVINKLSRYLWGKHFQLQTDHRPLTYLKSGRFRNARILRWALTLQEFQFSVLPIPGTGNVFADILSRTACSQEMP